MKKILTILAVITSLFCHGQIIKTPIILNKGTNGATDSTANYYSINGQDYPRGGYLRFNYSYVVSDSTIGIFYGGNQWSLMQPVMDTMFVYGDSTNKVVRNMNGLRAWLRKYAY